MPHTPPLPEGAQSPYPLHGDQAAALGEKRQVMAAKAASDLATGAETEAQSSRWPRYAAGAAIGSAAIAAALLYYNRAKPD